MSVTAYVALGSNLGDRQVTLDRAVLLLRAQTGLRVRRVSSYYETVPMGGPSGQGEYLNGAVEIETDLAPEELLRRLLDIERQLGRIRGESNAPRTLDLDLLLYGDLARSSPDPVLPHPRMHERRFVLVPLAEIAPNAIHPGLKATVQGLLDRLPPEANSPRKYEPAPFAHGGRELVGKRALVTGSTSGIGKAIAVEFAKAGASVIVHGRRSMGATEQVAADLREHYQVETHALLADLRVPSECGRLASAAWDHWGGLDILICNAGADLLTTEAATWKFERKWAELVAVDVTATMLLSRAIGERMKQAHGGVILTIGWDQAETGMEGDSGQLFGAAKGAVMAFTRSLAVSLAPEVRVNCLALGWIKTAWGETAGPAWQERVRSETLLQRWGLPEDVAAAARWLSSPAAAFITGQTIRINGGAVR
jgi:3-oxoacyl-[acyl-carrier protein] reductase